MININSGMWDYSKPDWVSPTEILDRLVSPPSYYEESLNKIFLPSITSLISNYAQGNLGPNAYNWYLVLRKLKVVPRLIPPVPFDIHEMFESTCPIKGAPSRLTETHSLWLIPGGIDLITTIDELAELCNEKRSTDFLGPEHPDLKKGTLRIRTKKTVGFKKPKWVVISNVLLFEGSSCYSDECKISQLRDNSFINYEFPCFKYALAVNLLKIQLDGKGLWEQKGKPRRLTRVQENYSRMKNRFSFVERCCYNLAVGHRMVKEKVITETAWTATSPDPEANGSDCDRDVGIAPIWIGFSHKSPTSNSYCILS